MSLKITGTSFKDSDGLKYFRKGAVELQMGSFGKKKEPIGSANYLDCYGTVKSKYLEDVQRSRPLSVDWKSTKWTDVAVSGTVPVFGFNVNLAVGYTQEKVRSADCKLFYLHLTNEQVVRLLNNKADNARKYLADEGADGRVLTGCWIVIEGKLAEQVSNATTFEASEGTTGLELTVSGGNVTKQSIVLAPGSLFAYKLSKVKKWDSHKTKVDEVADDWMA